MLNTFLNKQRQIEDFVEQNKQIIKTIDKTESHEFSIITTKIVNAANYELNSAQKQLEKLEFVYELQTLSNRELVFLDKI